MAGRPHRAQRTIPLSRQDLLYGRGHSARRTDGSVPGFWNHSGVRIKAAPSGFAEGLHHSHIVRIMNAIEKLAPHRLCLQRNQAPIGTALGHALAYGHQALGTFGVRRAVLMVIKRGRIQPADGFQGVRSRFMAYIATR